MFASSRLWLAFGTTILLGHTTRLTGTIKKKKDASSFATATESTPPESSLDSAIPPPHVDVFPSVRESLDRILGEEHTKNTNHTTDTIAQVPSYYIPMDLHGQPYDVVVAEPLSRAAAARWRSPVWATSAAFARAGCKILPGETGVRIPTSMQEVELYNLEQTDAPDGVISRTLMTGETAAAERVVPLTAAGYPFAMWVRRILQQHPSFRQYNSPYWANEGEVELLGTRVKRGQGGCGILIQQKPCVSSVKAATSSSSSTGVEGGIESEIPRNREESAVVASSQYGDFFMLYNAEQLEHPEKMTSENCPPTTFLSANGRRYGVVLTICMRQYCQKYNLRMSPVAVFITSARVRKMGGDLLPRDDAVPPFTGVLRDELLTLYHDDQTTISDQLTELAIRYHREKLNKVPVTIL